MSKIRVLVVDDAVVIRRLVADTLAADPDIEVVGTAANGKLALQRLEQLKPDLVTLDVEMPEMDGLQTLAALRKTHPRLPVIMFSTLTDKGAETTIEALTLGATDYVTKPSNVGSITLAIQCLKDDLIPKIKGLFLKRDATAQVNCPRPAAEAARPASPLLPRPTPPSASVRPAPPRDRLDVVDIVVIGVSTGGPNALAAVVPAFASDFPVPILIVQHMPPLFTRLLAERLAAKAQIPVDEGSANQILQPGRAWIAPGNYHMTVAQADHQVSLQLNQDPPENSCRPAVDVLFRSVAQLYGPRALAVVLTGMGQDGFKGCQLLREAGAHIVAQDEASSVVWGMPGFIANAGLADQILPLPEIGAALVRRVAFGRGAAGVRVVTPSALRR